jgi:hypothetical protein
VQIYCKNPFCTLAFFCGFCYNNNKGKMIRKNYDGRKTAMGYIHQKLDSQMTALSASRLVARGQGLPFFGKKAGFLGIYKR